MADISLSRRHQLGLKGARTAAAKMADKLGEKFDLSGDWHGDRLNFHRPGVTGFLVITETEFTLEVSLGFMLKMMKGPIESAVHEQLNEVLTTPAAKPAAKIAKKPAAAKTAAKKPAAKKK